MKTVVKEFNVYNLEELKSVDTEAYEVAMQNVKEAYTDSQIDFMYQEMADSINAFADTFNLSFRDYSFGIYQPSYINVDIDDYMELDNTEKNYLVKKANNLPNEDCAFTGVYTDFYITDYFKENKVTYNDLHKHLENVLSVALRNFIKDLENDLEDDNNMLEYAENNDFEFLKDGSIHH